MATVLVVDDIAANRELIVTLLAYQGHETIEAADGAEALTLVRAQRPALVISDILMPTMDGYELLRQLRSDPDLRNTPVIFYTAYPVFPSGTDDPDVVGYMSKAVDRADLYALLPPAIRRSRERRGGDS